MYRAAPYAYSGNRARGGGIRGRGRRGGLSGHRGRTETRSVTSPPSAAFGQTLQFITSIKLQELERQKVAYETHSRVLEEVNNIVDDLPLKVETLLKAVRSWSGSGAVVRSSVISGKLSLANLDRWILQANKDPSFSPDIITGWVDILEAHIRHSATRFECATLFGKLFNEWLSSDDSVTAIKPDKDSSDTDEAFFAVGRQEMHEQKGKLNSLIFDPKPIDNDALDCYLSNLFLGEESSSSLRSLRLSIEQFSTYLQRKVITAEDVRWTVQSLLASDLMSESKRNTLREFTQNPTVLVEVASVLNMRLSSLDSWSWPSTGVVIEMRRHLNGKYRAYTDPEILDALFLEYLGRSWQVKFKEEFVRLFSSKCWKQMFAPLSKYDTDRRKYYLNEPSSPPGIQTRRRALQEQHFMAGQLSSNLDFFPTYDDHSTDMPNPDDQPTELSATAIKQELLHIMATECSLNKSLHGIHTILRTDLEWFGPSLSHASILAVLEFFGVSREWLAFFETFLRAPLRFKEEPAAELRTRQCGTPISYALSALFGETVLFVMDFAVNQRADGLFLYRIHDDLWLWDSKAEKCVTAWQEMQRYASLVGLRFNVGKTGSACVGGEMNPDLPIGDIRWGFLKFQADEARFIIDQQDVDTHIVELRRQLTATKSIFGWVNAYNKYMGFFVRNFGGRPANCFGLAHVDDMIDTVAKIQRDLFPGVAGGAVGHLRAVLEARFGVHDLPQGYFYFPISSGCLGVRNPMVELLAVREILSHSLVKSFASQIEADAMRFQEQKEQWEFSSSSSSRRHDAYEFMPFDEYISQRETRLPNWHQTYVEMMIVPEPAAVDLTPAVEATLNGTWAASIGWAGKDYYEKWIVSLYGEELVKTFGSLEVVDASLIPVGMVQLYRSSRMKWEQ